MNKIKNILIILITISLLSSCLGKKEVEKKDKSKLTHKLQTDKNLLEKSLFMLNKKEKVLVKSYFTEKDEKKKEKIKDSIQKYMQELQSKIGKIKSENNKEKNKQIQDILKKIKIFKNLGF